jgi:hypothetical protein
MSIDNDTSLPGRKGHLYSFAQILFHLGFRHLKLTDTENLKEPADLLFPRNITWQKEVKNELMGIQIQSVVMTALFLEAYIYDYAARRIGDDMATRLDKLDPPSKYVVASKMVWKTGLIPSDGLYGAIKTLFKIRNKLVHNKSTNDGTIFDSPELTDHPTPSDNVVLTLNILDRFASEDPDDDVTRFILAQAGAWLQVAVNDTDFYPVPNNA